MAAEFESLLAHFPKIRTELPTAYRAIYAGHYRRNREGLTFVSSVTMKMEAWMHRIVASDVRRKNNSARTLEIGAGNLNHLQYEPESSAYDVVEDLSEICHLSRQRSRVRNVYRSVNEIDGASYDRIISIAALEHICDLPAVVAKCAILLAPGGQMRIAVPSEGTILWRLGWMLTSGIDFRLRYGLSYGVFMNYEHVNTAKETGDVLQVFFEDVRRKVFGIRPSLSFYQYFECRKPSLEQCRRYLERDVFSSAAGTPVLD
jgi:SAM-dependent methyltransferase